MEDVFELEVKLEELGIRSGEKEFIFLVVIEPQKRVDQVEEIARLLDRSLKVHGMANTIVPCVVVGDGVLLSWNEDILQRHVKGLIEETDRVKSLCGVLHLVVGDSNRSEPMAP